MISTRIFKKEVSGPLLLGLENLEGNGQADLRVHEGRDKALYGYVADAYPAWRKAGPDLQFSHGSMGKNVTFSSLAEDTLWIGSVYQLGTAKVSIAQPRFPCHRLGILFNDQSVIKQFNALNRSGVYFRVVEVGRITAGDSMKLIEENPLKVSVAELFNLYHGQQITDDRKREILSIACLPEFWRQRLSR